MRKAAVFGGAMIAVCLLFALSGPYAQRMVNGDGGGSASSPPVPVAVANFPQVQPVQVDKTVNVTGSVAVTNLPAVQQVAGEVSVGNLPTDESGALRTSTAAPRSRLLGFTVAEVRADQGIFRLTGACRAEYPNSHQCTTQEVVDVLDPPALPSADAWVKPVSAYLAFAFFEAVDVPTGVSSLGTVGDTLTCEGYRSASTTIVVDQDGRFGRRACDSPAPVACCGY